MGIIGKDLLNRIIEAERKDDWDLLINLLAMAQIEAMKNYKAAMQSLVTDFSKGEDDAN